MYMKFDLSGVIVVSSITMFQVYPSNNYVWDPSYRKITIIIIIKLISRILGVLNQTLEHKGLLPIESLRRAVRWAQL